MPAALLAELEVAVAAVRRAARVTAAVQMNLVRAQTLQKQDRSPVTVADFASQAVVCAALAEGFAADPIVAEENADVLRRSENAALAALVAEHAGMVLGEISQTAVLDWIDRGAPGPSPASSASIARSPSPGVSERFWTLDPIDGTKGFLRGEQYAIALALIQHGQIVLGVLGCPNFPSPVEPGEPGAPSGLGLLVAATVGAGATALPLDGAGINGGVALRVTDDGEPSAARFCESVESDHSDQGHAAAVAQCLGIRAGPLRMDSQAKYAAVARGDASIYLRLPTSRDYRENIWDHAAGTIVVEQAGGRVSDITGRSLDFSHGPRLEQNRGIVATNGRLHDAVIKAVGSVRAGKG